MWVLMSSRGPLQELEFIHRSCGTVGYRPNVFSTTLSHLIATNCAHLIASNCAHLILPFVSIRERLKEKVEEFFGCEFELFIEFTGLISWCKGASIGWHSDDNRPYLKQRDFAAVCYLNSHGKDFKGGEFHFKDGVPSTVVPIAGVIQFYYWKADELEKSQREGKDNMRVAHPSLLLNADNLELVLPCSHSDQLAETMLRCISHDESEVSLSLDKFELALTKCEEYTCSLQQNLLKFMPEWICHQSIFSSDPAEQ